MKYLTPLFLLAFGITPAAAADDSALTSPRVTFETTKGTIVLQLLPDKAPKTVKNFLSYVKAGFYDGTIFHRVIPGFMIQGGGLMPTMKEKPTHGPIKNEADNGLKNERGTIAMARTNNPHSATAQFFINLADNGFLNFKDQTMSGWGYTVFGEVIEGMDVVDAIAKVKTGSFQMHQDVPVEQILIQRATILDESS